MSEELQNEFRVGCFDGEYRGDTIMLTHDSIEEEIEVDIEEAEDIRKLIELIQMRQDADYLGGEHIKDFKRYARMLEA